MYLLVQGFNSYDGAINVPGNSGGAEQVAGTSAAAAVFIEKAAAQVCTCGHMCKCVVAYLVGQYVQYCTALYAVLLKTIKILHISQ